MPAAPADSMEGGVDPTVLQGCSAPAAVRKRASWAVPLVTASIESPLHAVDEPLLKEEVRPASRANETCMTCRETTNEDLKAALMGQTSAGVASGSPLLGTGARTTATA